MNCTATQALAIQQRHPRTLCRSCGVRERIPFRPHCGLCAVQAEVALLKARLAPGPVFVLNTKTGELKFR